MSKFAFPDANVTFAFEGMTIYHLNPTNNFWEFLFLRHLESHKLDLVITKFRTNSLSEGGVIHSSRIAVDQNISIDASQAEETPDDTKLLYERNTFNYVASSQTEDIRWMEEEDPSDPQHNLAQHSFRTDFPREKLSYLSIDGKSFLYTKVISDDEYEIWKIINANTKKLIKTRQVGTIVAADMKYPVGETVTIKVEGTVSYDLALTIEEGFEYEFRFDNTCDNLPTASLSSDYEHYYDLLDSSVKKFEFLKHIPKDGNGNVKLDNIKTGGVPACKGKQGKNLVGVNNLRGLFS